MNISPATCLLACWFLAEIISSNLKMEAIWSSETSVDTQRTTWRYIPEVDTLHNHRCENLTSHICNHLFSYRRQNLAINRFTSIQCPPLHSVGFLFVTSSISAYVLCFLTELRSSNVRRPNFTFRFTKSSYNFPYKYLCL
jgi:hypothetical protein